MESIKGSCREKRETEQMQLAELLIPTYRHMLVMLKALLDKTVSQVGREKAQDLLSARLAPDMYPLSSQIRFVALQAQEAVYRLMGEVLPAHLNVVTEEGRHGDDQPGTMATAKFRLDEAIACLDRVGRNAMDAGEERLISIELPDGVIFDLNGMEYIRDWALAQFYFHVVTAYAILRKEGIEIGKADYVPHMLAYLRAMP
jgi:hypothetical protein